MSFYTVNKGETLSQIARDKGHSLSDLTSVNPKINPDKLQIGQVLIMPDQEGTQQETVTKEFSVVSEPEKTDISTYKVNKNDTLGKIAQKNGCSVAQLKAANNLQSDMIKVGQILIIPTRRTTQPIGTTSITSKTSNRQQSSNATSGEKTKYYRALIHSATAERHNIDNSPKDEKTKENLDKFITNTLLPLDKTLKEHGIEIKISSGYRSTELNKKVGGKITSQHCRGEACDFQVIPNNQETLKKAFSIIKNSGIPVDQMLLEYNNRTKWIHISYNSNGNNRRYFNDNYKA